jgi:hypothetical protein
MRFGRKMMVWAFCAGPAVAAKLAAGSGPAGASVLTPVSNSGVAFGPHGPSGPNCSRWQLERWNLNGPNTISTVYLGVTYTYSVNFVQNGSCRTGRLTDTFIPAPARSPARSTERGARELRHLLLHLSDERPGDAHLSRHDQQVGAVSGNWVQTGTQVPNNASWSLAYKAAHACPRFWWWSPRHECFVRSR